MFGIGLPEMIVILIVALLVVGPDKLPDLARSLAKGINELRGVMHQVKESLNEETKEIKAVKDELQESAGQMRENFLDNLGGPRQEHSFDMNADSSNSRPWEQGKEEEVAATQHEALPEQEIEAVEDEALAAELATEQRVMGKNPSPADPS